MTPADYADLSIRACALALASYAIVGQVRKPLLRLLVGRWRRGKAPTRGQEAALRAVTRSGAVVVGGLLGLLDVWPTWFQAAWGPLLGLGAGGLAVPIHHAVERALPARIAAVIGGGSVVHREEEDAPEDEPR